MKPPRAARKTDTHPVRLRLIGLAAGLLSLCVGVLVLYWTFTQPPTGPAGAAPAAIGLSIAPLDPRASGGQDAGSRALYFDVAQDGQRAPLVHALKEGRGVEVWEVLTRNKAPSAAGFYATLAYDAPGYAPDCLIEEWGISVRPVSPPRGGVALRYAAPRDGGGTAALSAGVKLLPDREFDSDASRKQFFPVARWSGGGRGVVRISPGRSAHVLMRAEAGGTPGDKASRASELRAYARVKVGRTRKLVESSDAVYAVWLDDDALVATEASMREPMENLRSLAYVPRTPPQPALAAAPAVATPPQPGYVLQLAAFRDQNRARELAKRVTRAGFGCAVTRVPTSDGRTFYRVRLTPAMSKAEAERLRAKFAQRVAGLQPVVMPASAGPDQEPPLRR